MSKYIFLTNLKKVTSPENTSKPYKILITILTKMVLIVQEIISCTLAFGQALVPGKKQSIK